MKLTLVTGGAIAACVTTGLLVGPVRADGVWAFGEHRHNQAPQSGTGVIAGSVVIAGTDRPAVDAVVTLTDSQSKSTTTDNQGRFAFVGLSPGLYSLSASKERYLSVTYGQIRPGSTSMGVSIRLGGGERLDHFRLALPLAGVITGRVTDLTGEPLQGVAMSAIRFTWRTGERGITVVSDAVSDDRGEYRLSSLVPGEYLVVARPKSRPTDGTPAAIYYPAALSATLASPLTLDISEVRQSVDFQLPRIALARVRGQAIGIDGNPIGNVPIEAAHIAPELSLGAASTYAGDDGRFSLPGLSPGRYRLFAFSELGGWATLDLAVGERDIENVQLRFLPTGVVSGRVVLEDGRTPVADVALQINQPTGTATLRHQPPSARADAKGVFTINRVHEGAARLWLGRVPSDLAVKSVQLNGQDAFDLPFEVGPAADLKELLVTLTTRKASVIGTLFDARNLPTPDYLVLVFATDERYWFFGSRHIATTRPNSDGRFLFDALPPGSYRIVALTDAEEGQWFDPHFLRASLDRSIPVTVREGEQSRQDLRLRQSR